MGFWQTVFVVLMILWLIGGGWYGSLAPSGSERNGRYVSTFIPWTCVAILGAIVLGGLPR